MEGIRPPVHTNSLIEAPQTNPRPPKQPNEQFDPPQPRDITFTSLIIPNHDVPHSASHHREVAIATWERVEAWERKSFFAHWKRRMERVWREESAWSEYWNFVRLFFVLFACRWHLTLNLLFKGFDNFTFGRNYLDLFFVSGVVRRSLFCHF